MKTNKIIYIFIISLTMIACEPVAAPTDSNYDPESKLKELGIFLFFLLMLFFSFF